MGNSKTQGYSYHTHSEFETPPPSYQPVYYDCRLHHRHPTDGFGDPLQIEENPADEFFEELPEQILDNDLPWADFAALNPRRDGAIAVNPDALGNRPIDLHYDWNAFVNRYQVADGWLAQEKSADPGVLEAGEVSRSVIDSLGLRQRQLYDLVIDQAKKRQARRENPFALAPEQLLYHADGKAGTGKSFTIKATSSTLEKTLGNVLLRAAPTGIAAHIIQGRTLHSLLRLPIAAGEMPRLSPRTLSTLQANFRDVTAMIIDEKSMLSLSTLSHIDQRLRQIFPNSSGKPLGGLDIGKSFVQQYDRSEVSGRYSWPGTVQTFRQDHRAGYRFAGFLLA